MALKKRISGSEMRRGWFGFFRTWALQRHHMLLAQPAALWKDRWSYFSE